jgi:hypothetical protein
MLLVLLVLAAALTLPLALGNPLVANAPPAWKLWRGTAMIVIVVFTYWALGIWIVSPSGPTFSVAMSWQGRPDWFVGTEGFPIEMAFIMEFTNLKNTNFMIRSYELQDKGADGSWVSADAIPAWQAKDGKFYKGTDVRDMTEVKYTCFDSVIANKNIDAGDTARGWVFFQRWPPTELRLKVWGTDGSTTAENFRPLPRAPSDAAMPTTTQK